MSELHPLNCMPPELQVAHYVKQIIELRDLLDSCGREGKKVLADNYKLRNLNAEMLAVLELIPRYRYCLPSIVVEKAELAIKKASERRTT